MISGETTPLASEPKRWPAGGRDELNLIDFPIGVLQYQQPTDSDGQRPDELVCTIESFDKDLDRVVPRKLTRRTSSRHGFPTPLEDDVLVGLLTLTRMKNDFQSPRVTFRNSELYDLMRWPHNGASNRRLSIALDRLKGLVLKYENSWTSRAGRFEKEFTTGLLDSYQLVTQSDRQGAEDPSESWVVWASEVFADIQQGNVKELDTEQFFRLDRPIARRLYRFLDKHLTDHRHFEIDLLTLAAHLGISGTAHIGKIKERLRQSIEQLEAVDGFIRPATPEQRYRKQGRGQWVAVFDRATNDQAAAKGEGKPRPSDAPRQLVLAFYARWSGDTRHFVTRHELRQAREVIDAYGEEQAIALVPKVVRLMKQAFPNANAFGATMNYWHQADKAARRTVQSPQQTSEPTDDTAKRDAERQELAQLREQWSRLSDAEVADIRSHVAEHSGPTIRSFLSQGRYDDILVERACLNEMRRRQQSLSSSTPSTHTAS